MFSPKFGLFKKYKQNQLLTNKTNLLSQQELISPVKSEVFKPYPEKALNDFLLLSLVYYQFFGILLFQVFLRFTGGSPGRIGR